MFLNNTANWLSYGFLTDDLEQRRKISEAMYYFDQFFFS